MGSDELQVKSEALATTCWPFPLNSSKNFSQGAYEESMPLCISESNSSLPAWNFSTMPFQSFPKNLDSQTFQTQQNYLTGTEMGGNKSLPSNYDQKSIDCGTDFSFMGWNSKSRDDSIDLNNYDTEMNLGMTTQEFTTNTSSPNVNLRYSESILEGDQCNFRQLNNNRRLSLSSFTMSTTGPLLEMQPFDEFSTTASESASFTSSDYLPPSNRNSLMSSKPLSPVVSPRITPQRRSDFFWSQSRGRANPSPRAILRSAPYHVDCSRNKRWSTGSYALTSNRRPSSFVSHQHQEISNSKMHQISSRHSSPTLQSLQQPFNMSDINQTQPQSFFVPDNFNFNHSNALLSSRTYDDLIQFKGQAPTLSNKLFQMLQSSGDIHSMNNHFHDFCEPPDLYASLHEEQSMPPPEDMNPSIPELIPHEQELRFEGDLYTPRWVRGHGNKREGWCGICKPGRWLILKNSAFWYDKSFTHGISAATGSPFREPQETRRMDGNPDVWEGLCGSCNEWVALVSSKKKGTTWFRHAYKHIRVAGPSKIVKSKIDSPRAQLNLTSINEPHIDGMALGNERFIDINDSQNYASDIQQQIFPTVEFQSPDNKNNLINS